MLLGSNMQINPTRLTVADITLSFFNSEIVKLLKVRGKMIATRNLDEAPKIEEQIIEFMNKNE